MTSTVIDDTDGLLIGTTTIERGELKNGIWEAIARVIDARYLGAN